MNVGLSTENSYGLTVNCMTVVIMIIPIDISICDLFQEKGPLGIFIKIEFLAWVDSSFCVEYNGTSFKENLDHKRSYGYFYALG